MIIIKPYVKGIKLIGKSTNGFKSVSFIDVHGTLTVGKEDVRYIHHTKNGIEIKVGDDSTRVYILGSFTLDSMKNYAYRE